MPSDSVKHSGSLIDVHIFEQETPLGTTHINKNWGHFIRALSILIKYWLISFVPELRANP